MQYQITKIIRAPREKVFAWCTDYDPKDPERAKNPAFKARRIVRREANFVIVEDDYEGLPKRIAKVKLFPPERWEADLQGGLWRGHGTYRLEEIPEGTKLTITFQIRGKNPNVTVKQIRQRGDSVWSNYVSAMEAELKTADIGGMKLRIPTLEGFTRWEEIPEQKVNEKISRKIVSGNRVMMVLWQMKAGALAALHKHPNEQIAYVVSGQMELRFRDQKKTCRPGDLCVIPQGVEHEAWFPQDCTVIDIFSPPREDFFTGQDTYLKSE